MSVLARIAAVTLLSTVVPLAAQGMLVVPSATATTEGNALRAFPGVSVTDRLQIVVADTELATLSGHTLVGVRLRRDTTFPRPLAEASGEIVVRVGVAARPPEAAVANFAANLPISTEVFRGTVTAPSSPAGVTNPSWANDANFELRFSSGLAYAGGPLCIECEGLTGSGLWWPVDAVSDPIEGTVVSIGTACGARASFGETASASPSGFVVGRSATFSLLGEPQIPAWLLVGFGLLAQPVDLTPLGAAGCTLHVDMISGVPALIGGPLAGFDGAGLASAMLDVPAMSGLLGGQLVAQWLELTPPGFVTSNALLCTIAAAAPSLPVVAVSARDTELPTVHAVGVPVLGLLWQ